MATQPLKQYVKQGKAFLFFPEKAELSNRETNIEKLESCYQESLIEAEKWVENLHAWL